MFFTLESYYKFVSTNKIFLVVFLLKSIFLLFFNFGAFLQFHNSEKFIDFPTNENRVSENDSTSLGCFLMYLIINKIFNHATRLVASFLDTRVSYVYKCLLKWDVLCKLYQFRAETCFFQVWDLRLRRIVKVN